MTTNFEDFKYCIWYVPEKDHPWNRYTDGFNPHMTIVSHLEKEESEKIFSKINKIKTKVKIIGNIKQYYGDNFYALLYNIEPITAKPEWWPENAHVSFRYRYNNSFTEEEIDKLQKEIKIKEAILDDIKIVRCSGHYEGWKKID